MFDPSRPEKSINNIKSVLTKAGIPLSVIEGITSQVDAAKK
jgi:hypothetical protein